MHVIHEVLGNLSDTAIEGLEIDVLEIEWFESTKRIQRKVTRNGQEFGIKFLKEGQRLRDGDIVFRDVSRVVLIHIKPCDAIVIKPTSMLEMGTVCYEIGNKHMPLFIENDEVLMPYENPMFRWLEASGYNPEKQYRQLLNILKSNVEPHNHGNSDGSLFSKILNLAASVSKDN